MAEDKKTAVKSLFGKKKGKPAGKLNLKVLIISFLLPQRQASRHPHTSAKIKPPITSCPTFLHFASSSAECPGICFHALI
jgi:hypothetical protein